MTCWGFIPAVCVLTNSYRPEKKKLFVRTQTAGVTLLLMVLSQAGAAYAAPPSTNQYRIRGISQKGN